MPLTNSRIPDPLYLILQFTLTRVSRSKTYPYLFWHNKGGEDLRYGRPDGQERQPHDGVRHLYGVAYDRNQPGDLISHDSNPCNTHEKSEGKPFDTFWPPHIGNWQEEQKINWEETQPPYFGQDSGRDIPRITWNNNIFFLNYLSYHYNQYCF